MLRGRSKLRSKLRGGRWITRRSQRSDRGVHERGTVHSVGESNGVVDGSGYPPGAWRHEGGVVGECPPPPIRICSLRHVPAIFGSVGASSARCIWRTESAVIVGDSARPDCIAWTLPTIRPAFRRASSPSSSESKSRIRADALLGHGERGCELSTDTRRGPSLDTVMNSGNARSYTSLFGTLVATSCGPTATHLCVSLHQPCRSAH